MLGVTVRSNTVAGAILKQFVYAYDKAGNRTGEQIQSGAGPACDLERQSQQPESTDQRLGRRTMRFKGSLDELGTVKVAGTNAPVDSRATNNYRPNV